MALEKLRPDRDLQCYFEQPSAIAALSGASATGFTVSGCWRQQFDWCVIEWNRDNGFEHPAFRNLPDGDLSGLTLTYEETRENCIPIDSSLYPTVDWPHLRVWVEGRADPYFVPLLPRATAIEGAYGAASTEFELTGTITPGDHVGLSWLGEQYNYAVSGSDTLESAAAAVAAAVNAFSATMRATVSEARITLTCVQAGANGNRIGAYGFVSGARTEQWSPWWRVMSGGTSPSKWRIEIAFGALTDKNGAAVPTTAVRKLRWTYAAELQRGAFERSEFAVHVTNWTVTGGGRAYHVAGPQSMRMEDDSDRVTYAGAWSEWHGNYSGGSLHVTNAAGASVTSAWRATAAHSLYLGALKADGAGQVSVAVDGGAPAVYDLRIAGEEQKARVPLGDFAAGEHTVTATLTGGGHFYFDFFEAAVPTTELPVIEADSRYALATDWDTDHSLAIAPERTAWMIDALGFRGRVNHYVGALRFYELAPQGFVYASGTVEFAGEPEFGARTEVTIGRAGDPASNITLLHVHRIGDTAATVAKAFELEINRGYTSVRAEAAGATLHVFARAIGAQGNLVTLAATTTSAGFSATASGPALAGGTNGEWRTDLAASPRLNRAARDWHRSYFAALAARGMEAVAAFSLELGHADPSEQAGIAQRCPAGDPVLLPTPAVQTNFSAASRDFWKPVYQEMAALMEEAGLAPYLQFGEVQWWYFRDQRSGMPYYDAWTKARFQSQYGREMATIVEHTALVAEHPEEAAFLPGLIGEFTQEIMAAVPGCRFEVLYPLDVNDTDWNRAVNYPAAAWTPATIETLKTESFGFTYNRDLDKCLLSIREPAARGFTPGRSAHLIGLSDARSPWVREARLAWAEGIESVVLFALDQFAMIGYGVPLARGSRRAAYFG